MRRSSPSDYGRACRPLRESSAKMAKRAANCSLLLRLVKAGPVDEIARLLQFPGAVAVVEIGGEQAVLLLQRRQFRVQPMNVPDALFAFHGLRLPRSHLCNRPAKPRGRCATAVWSPNFGSRGPTYPSISRSGGTALGRTVFKPGKIFSSTANPANQTQHAFKVQQVESRMSVEPHSCLTQ